MQEENVKKEDYANLNRAASIIMAIIPITCWVLGFITRFKEKGGVPEGIIRLFLGWNILWVLDLISLIVEKQIFRFIEPDPKKEKQNQIKKANRAKKR